MTAPKIATKESKPSEAASNPSRSPEHMRALAAYRGRLLAFAKTILAAADNFAAEQKEEGGKK